MLMLPVLDSRGVPRSNGAYASDKALCWPDRLEALRRGAQPYPVHLHLIVSDLCAPLSCPGCAYRLDGYSSNELFVERAADGTVTNRNPKRMLSLPLVEQILDDCVTMGVRATEFTGGGEPTVHPDFPQILAGAQRRKLDTALITHGLLIEKRKLVGLAAQTVWTRISIDAATRGTYGVVRPSLGGPHGENLDVALSALSAIRRERDTYKGPTTLGAGFVVQKENWRELYDAVKLYRDHGADNVRVSGLFTPEGDRYFEGWRDEALELERRAVADFDGKSGFRVYGRLGEKIEDLQARPDYSTCWYQQLTTYIGGDGNLYRCCVYSYSRHGLIGSVAERGFKALWDSEAKQAKFAHFDARSCARCQFGDRNRAINGFVQATDLPPAPGGVIHPSFV